MSQQLINHSADLQRLKEQGYEITICGGYLLVHHIPYVNSRKEIAFGVLVSTLALSGTTTQRPDTHVIHFIGDHPCNKDGSVIAQISHASQNQRLHERVTVNHSFSNKPPGGYPDYYEKIVRYADIISAPAKSLDPAVTEKTFLVHANEDASNVFQYTDTNSSRARINLINDKFKGQHIAIIGLGGTGAYVLDQVAKTPVESIHLYDGDLFLQHNAFRSPGAASLEQLIALPKKVDYYAALYSNMHKHIVPHPEYVTTANLPELTKISYVFICVDRNSARKLIMGALLAMKVPFIDAGLGIEIVDDFLIGAVRVTTGTNAKNDHLVNRVAMEDPEDEAYESNIQIADLNMLNAALAVIKWKKMSLFYQDLIEDHNAIYTINAEQLTTTDFTT